MGGPKANFQRQIGTPRCTRVLREHKPRPESKKTNAKQRRRAHTLHVQHGKVHCARQRVRTLRARHGKPEARCAVELRHGLSQIRVGREKERDGTTRRRHSKARHAAARHVARAGVDVRCACGTLWHVARAGVVVRCTLQAPALTHVARAARRGTLRAQASTHVARGSARFVALAWTHVASAARHGTLLPLAWTHVQVTCAAGKLRCARRGREGGRGGEHSMPAA